MPGDDAIVRVQGAMRLSPYSQPYPDIVLMRPRPDFYAARLPGPADILLILEVAESSLDYDRDVKGAMCAESGIPEYWLADLGGGVLSCSSEPRGRAYRVVRQYRAGVSVAPLLLPDCAIATDMLFGWV